MMHRITLGSGAGALSPAVATWMRTGGRRRVRPREQGLPHPLELGTPPPCRRPLSSASAPPPPSRPRRPPAPLPVRIADLIGSRVSAGSLVGDGAQRRAASRLDSLAAALDGYDNREAFEGYDRAGRGGAAAPGRPGIVVPRGLFLHGPVGTGKTMVMDLFHEHVPVPAKRRVHFHSFLADVHRRIHALKRRDLAERGRDFAVDTSVERNPIHRVATQLASEVSLLCFDEFQVTDVADALILSQLFGTMWARGVVTVATSNRPPGDLYEGGINRGYFLPFIDLLRRHCVVHEVGSSTDYRRLLSDGMDEFLFVARDGENQDDANAKCDDFFSQLLDGAEPRSLDLNVAFNRTLHVRQAHPDGTIGRFDFDELCSVELGSSDYRALAGQFRAVLMEGIPVLTLEEHDKARRFITLIDELYEADCALACSAVAPPDHLFRGRSGETTREEESKHETGGIEVKVGEMFGIDVAQSSGKTVGDLASVRELAFAFERASSRMTEMCSKSWWQKAQP